LALLGVAVRSVPGRPAREGSSGRSQRKETAMEMTPRNEMPSGNGKAPVNPDALNQLLGRMVNDLGAAVNGALIVLGEIRAALFLC